LVTECAADYGVVQKYLFVIEYCESRLGDLLAKTGQHDEALIQHKNALNHLKHLYKNISG
jgi:hypothetical protein